MSGLLLLRYVDLYKALAHPTRISILRVLLDNKLGVGDLTQRLKKRQANVSQHLQILKAIKLVKSRKVGKERIYEISANGKDLIDYLSRYNS